MIGVPKNDDMFMYNVKAEDFVPEGHPLRRIRSSINATAIRRLARPLYSSTGRPSIPPEQLFLALVAGYVMGITSERKIHTAELRYGIPLVCWAWNEREGLGRLHIQPKSSKTI